MSAALKQLVVIIALLAVSLTSPFAFNMVLSALIIYALTGPEAAIKAVSLSVVLKYINPALASYDALAGILFWVLTLAFGMRVLPLLRNLNATIVSIFIFSLVALLLSLVSSLAVLVSVMKIATFAWLTTTVLVAFSLLNSNALERTKQWLACLVLVVVGTSALTLLRPEIAYNQVRGSLQGILNQPQSLGTFLAPVAAWTLASVLLARTKVRTLDIVTAAVVWTVMFLSLARTAAVAAVGAILIAILTRLFAGRRASSQAGMTQLLVFVLTGLIAIVAINEATGQIERMATSFILKRKSTDISSSFDQSRGLGIASQWNNFLDSPILGHGFGVYADGRFPAGIVEVAGIPISAPVEKGFVPTAILEETGIFGGILFICLIISLAVTVWKNTDLRWVAAFWAALLINIGEAVIMAPGGIGLYIWIVIGVCAASGRLAGADQLEITNDELVVDQHAVAPNLMR